MGSTSRSFSNTASWTFKYDYPDEIKITGSTFSLSSVIPSVTAYASLPAGTWSSDIRGVASAYFTILGTSISYTYGTWLTTSWPSGTWKTLSGSTTYTKNTSTYFNSNNSTTRKVLVQATNSGSATISDAYYNITYTGNLGSGTVNLGYLVLDVPPTFNTTQISFDTPYVYTGLTTASVTVSDATAYYGGSITDITLQIGTATDTLTGDGTLSILLDTVGTFTPTITATDSRGQTKTITLDPITVSGYNAPTVSFTADRTTSTGIPDDEGTYATLDATFRFTDVVANLIAPSVVLTDENGTQTTPTVTWYSSRAADGTLSGSVTWSNLSYGDTVYGLVPGLNTNYSYQVSVRPRDTQGTGTAVAQTVAPAFYTVDFLAGGHGIAFGKLSENEGFECAMNATFEEDLVAQDMTQQEVDDFVDSLVVGGGGTVVDLVVEQGTSGIWTYRKWLSGIAECWGKTSQVTVATSAWTSWGSLYEASVTATATNYPTDLFISAPQLFANPFPISGGATMLELASGGTKDVAPRVWATRATKPSNAVVLEAHFYAIGRWK